MKDQCGPSPFVSFFGTMLVIKLSIDCKSDNWKSNKGILYIFYKQIAINLVIHPSCINVS